MIKAIYCEKNPQRGMMKLTVTYPAAGGTEDIPDDILMARVAKGSQQAFAVLLHKYTDRYVRVALRYVGNVAEAEDITQEAFIRLWRLAPDWEGQQGRGAQLTTWLYRVVVNLSIDHLRRNKRLVYKEQPEQEDTAPDASGILEQKRQSRRIQQAVQELPDRQKTALILTFYEGLDDKQAADVMGIGVKALESLLVRARRQLRETLKQEIELLTGGRYEQAG